ncbi:1112_t:CDS:2 [Dentiscutata erythropus]|uniref:1112_t:CDS:1 n=1 Tax=Dentiscutata erythropus TaxID=1348616 RepID=A0A9N8YRK9_9GLOM|nr:1112_t:CDS:2 [Dentiscutata erythropus]
MNSQKNEFIPIDKLLENLENLKNESLEPLAVLLACGSYNPIHKFHVEIFKITKTYLEKEKICKVVIGYISPSPQLYLDEKYPKEAIPLKHRIEMIKLAIKESSESSWLDYTAWESSSPKNIKAIVDYHEIIKNLSEFLNKNVKQELKGRKLEVIYLCGLDEILKTERNGLNDLEDYKIAIVERHLKDSRTTSTSMLCKTTGFIITYCKSEDNSGTKVCIRFADYSAIWKLIIVIYTSYY